MHVVSKFSGPRGQWRRVPSGLAAVAPRNRVVYRHQSNRVDDVLRASRFDLGGGERESPAVVRRTPTSGRWAMAGTRLTRQQIERLANSIREKMLAREAFIAESYGKLTIQTFPHGDGFEIEFTVK